jgi:hypothetical protein
MPLRDTRHPIVVLAHVLVGTTPFELTCLVVEHRRTPDSVNPSTILGFTHNTATLRAFSQLTRDSIRAVKKMSEVVIPSYGRHS